jgi:hypothetical protein
MASVTHIFGIRHHGPGSARSLLAALDATKPDCVLIEGPPDADEVIALAAHKEMSPPVAVLIYAVDEPSRAVYYPFAAFSPEWNAVRWALEHQAAVRFMDLPQMHRMAIDVDREKKVDEKSDAPATSDASSQATLFDPIGELAKAAGFDDGERWWEYLVEHREHDGPSIFDAIRDAMAALREARAHSPDEDEPLREAWMRRTIREAQKQGFKNIAVVCGAWHSPVLDVDSVPKKQDDELFKGLPKIKTKATWVPWTYQHLTFLSGYGAGVYSPGWYEHIWTSRRQRVLESWMTRVARLLRDKDIDCSSAHVIEAVRLAQTLATMRARPLADLSDIADATRSVFCFDSDLPMRLISRELLIGDRLGEVPEETPVIPLQQDLQQLQKKLRLKPEALEKVLDLDLRNDTDLQRSHLLHRLNLLKIPWGVVQRDGASGGKGTFHEIWQLRWEPGFIVKLIEAGSLGNTIEHASTAKIRQLATTNADLRSLAALLDDALLANLGEAVESLVQQVENIAAVAADVSLLMETLPQLVRVMRYGNVRQTDAGRVKHIIDGIVPRITVGLGGAVASLNDEAATQMEERIRGVHGAIQLIESPQHSDDWIEALRRIIDQPSIHGLIRGRSTRLLLDAGKLDSERAAKRMSLALSIGSDPWQSAQWVEGFLAGSGLLLIHDAKLLRVLDEWVAEIQQQTFDTLVPLLRRTFSTFDKPERRQIGQIVASGGTMKRTSVHSDDSIDESRGRRALPLLLQILGAQVPSPGQRSPRTRGGWKG